MRFLRQSTSVDVPIGPFLDAGDGVTPEIALTITQPDVRLKKNGGDWAQKAAAQTLAHEENGYYEVTLDATDTNTLGLMRLAVNETGACPVWEDFMVFAQSVWDALFGTGNLPANVLALNGVITAAAKFEQGATALVTSTCTTGSTTTQVRTNLTEATNDHYKGRIVTFTSGALAGQSTDITSYDGVNKYLNVTQLTEAPASTDAFVIS
jgi:hypothetical protein